jgi:hypothetical protein
MAETTVVLAETTVVLAFRPAKNPKPVFAV